MNTLIRWFLGEAWPPLVAALRAGTAAGLTAFIGQVAVLWPQVDWGSFAPYSIVLLLVFRTVIEGGIDWLKPTA